MEDGVLAWHYFQYSYGLKVPIGVVTVPSAFIWPICPRSSYTVPSSPTFQPFGNVRIAGAAGAGVASDSLTAGAAVGSGAGCWRKIVPDGVWIVVLSADSIPIGPRASDTCPLESTLQD